MRYDKHMAKPFTEAYTTAIAAIVTDPIKQVIDCKPGFDNSQKSFETAIDMLQRASTLHNMCTDLQDSYTKIKTDLRWQVDPPTEAPAAGGGDEEKDGGAGNEGEGSAPPSVKPPAGPPCMGLIGSDPPVDTARYFQGAAMKLEQCREEQVLDGGACWSF